MLELDGPPVLPGDEIQVRPRHCPPLRKTESAVDAGQDTGDTLSVTGNDRRAVTTGNLAQGGEPYPLGLAQGLSPRFVVIPILKRKLRLAQFVFWRSAGEQAFTKALIELDRKAARAEPDPTFAADQRSARRIWQAS